MLDNLVVVGRSHVGKTHALMVRGISHNRSILGRGVVSWSMMHRGVVSRLMVGRSMMGRSMLHTAMMVVINLLLHKLILILVLLMGRPGRFEVGGLVRQRAMLTVLVMLLISSQVLQKFILDRHTMLVRVLVIMCRFVLSLMFNRGILHHRLMLVVLNRSLVNHRLEVLHGGMLNHRLVVLCRGMHRLVVFNRYMVFHRLVIYDRNMVNNWLLIFYRCMVLDWLVLHRLMMFHRCVMDHWLVLLHRLVLHRCVMNNWLMVSNRSMMVFHWLVIFHRGMVNHLHRWGLEHAINHGRSHVPADMNLPCGRHQQRLRHHNVHGLMTSREADPMAYKNGKSTPRKHG